MAYYEANKDKFPPVKPPTTKATASPPAALREKLCLPSEPKLKEHMWSSVLQTQTNWTIETKGVNGYYAHDGQHYRLIEPMEYAPAADETERFFSHQSLFHYAKAKVPRVQQMLHMEFYDGFYLVVHEPTTRCSNPWDSRFHGLHNATSVQPLIKDILLDVTAYVANGYTVRISEVHRYERVISDDGQLVVKWEPMQLRPLDTLLTQCTEPVSIVPECKPSPPATLDKNRAMSFFVGSYLYKLLTGHGWFMHSVTENTKGLAPHKYKTSEVFWHSKNNFTKVNWENEDLKVHATPEAMEFLKGVMEIDPTKRWTLEQALKSKWITQ